MKKTSAKMKMKMKMEHFSVLPDELVIAILSLLPTLMATRTSVLSRRFRHLWKASPSADLYFSTSLKKSSIAMAKSVLLMSNLLHLDLEFNNIYLLKGEQSFIYSLPWPKGLRNLTINGKGCFCLFESILLSIFSYCISLESLSIHLNPPLDSFTFPSLITFTRLKSLSINLGNHNLTTVKRILSELSCLEHLLLHIFSSSRGVVCLSSLTIKKLELLLLDGSKPQEEAFYLLLSMPTLDFLSLTNHKDDSEEYANVNVPFIYGDGDLIRKAVVTLGDLCQKDITAVAQLLNFISNVEHLTLYLKEHRMEEYPIPVLMEPGKKPPTFPNLKHLDMSLCFYESNFEAVVTMLHHSTALESLKLHHKTREILDLYGKKLQRNGDQKRNAWRSKLPRNRDGNYQYACFENLHLGENRKEFKKLLNKKCTPKRQLVGR